MAIGAKEEMNPLQRVGIAPLEVIENEQDGVVGGQERTRQGLEERLALPRLDGRGRARDVRSPGDDLGHQPRDLAEGPDVESCEHGRENWAAQPVGDRGKGQATLRGIGPRPRRLDSLSAGPLGEFRGQPRLSDAGLTADDDEMSLAEGHPVPG